MEKQQPEFILESNDRLRDQSEVMSSPETQLERVAEEISKERPITGLDQSQTARLMRAAIRANREITKHSL